MNRAEHHRLLRYLLSLGEAERRAAIEELAPEEQRELRHNWCLYARSGQVPPDGDWRTWLILAGRGFGKTRAGAEWVRALAEADPGVRVALVGATLAEARAVMVEGESGVMAVCPPGRRPAFEPSLRRLTWPNGAQATLYSAGEPEALRGPQHTHAQRPGRERVLRQRSPCPGRRPHPLRRRGRDRHAALGSGRRAVLAGRPRTQRGMGRPCGPDRLPSARKLAVRGAARRPSPAQSGDEPNPPVPWRLGRPCGAGLAERRNHGRQRSPCRPGRSARRAGRGWHFCRTLKGTDGHDPRWAADMGELHHIST